MAAKLAPADRPLTRKKFVAEFTAARRRAYAKQPDKPGKAAEDVMGMIDAGFDAMKLWRTHRLYLKTLTVGQLRELFARDTTDFSTLRAGVKRGN